MKLILKLFIVTFCFTFFNAKSDAQEINLDSIDSYIKKITLAFDVPGMSVGIVMDDSLIFSKGYGVKDIERGTAVDENTIFGIGSISKSLTALTLGILVDERKIDWDDKVIDYIPNFELYSPFVTQNFTIRDLLTHRSGLKQVSGGTLWYHSDYSRKQIIDRMKYLKPDSDFRYSPAYQNIMYMVAGEIVSKASGMEWDDFLQERVFNKIQMYNSTSKSTVREANRNIARPHILDENNNLIKTIQERGDNLAAAGFVYSSSNNMGNYMKLMLNKGIWGNDTIISEKTLNELFKPQIHFPFGIPPLNSEFTSYGFGWFLCPLNGDKLITHSGGIDGMSANLIMIKEKKIGVIVLINTSSIASFVITNKILADVFQMASLDVYDLALNFQKSLNKKSPEKNRTEDTSPSLTLTEYCGTYSDTMYGDIIISKDDSSALTIHFSHTPLFSGTLQHWHYDTFKVDWSDKRVPDGFITFSFNSEQHITGFSIDQENLLDVDFTELNITTRSQ